MYSFRQQKRNLIFFKKNLLCHFVKNAYLICLACRHYQKINVHRLLCEPQRISVRAQSVCYHKVRRIFRFCYTNSLRNANTELIYIYLHAKISTNSIHAIHRLLYNRFTRQAMVAYTKCNLEWWCEREGFGQWMRACIYNILWSNNSTVECARCSNSCSIVVQYPILNISFFHFLFFDWYKCDSTLRSIRITPADMFTMSDRARNINENKMYFLSLLTILSSSLGLRFYVFCKICNHCAESLAMGWVLRRQKCI